MAQPQLQAFGSSVRGDTTVSDRLLSYSAIGAAYGDGMLRGPVTSTHSCPYLTSCTHTMRADNCRIVLNYRNAMLHATWQVC